MNQRLIKSSDGFVWLDVTDRAREVFDLKLFRLFLLWQKEDKTLRIPVENESEYDYAISSGNKICVYVGKMGDGSSDRVTIDSWDTADKLTHNGYVYVRYADLSFCK